MKTTTTFTGLTCTASGETFDPTLCHHPEDRILDPNYDYDAIDLTRAALEQRPFVPEKYEALSPIPVADLVSLGEGGTPLVACPSLAEELGVGRCLIKDEGTNPTGTIKDREHALAVSAAVGHGATDVALPSTGVGGQSAAAYAARGGLTSHVFVPARAPFATKAMINVHGGDMSVVGGRLSDAVSAFEAAMAEREAGNEGKGVDNEDWYSLRGCETPYRHEGIKPVLYELIEQLEWEVPDAVFCPFVGSTVPIGLAKAARELRTLGLIDSLPPLYAAQSEGCAPIVEAFESGAEAPEPWETPDTVCGELERPDPMGGQLVLEAIRESSGGAVATSDEEITESAVTVATHEGVEMGVSAGVAASAAWAMKESFDEDDTVVLINTTAGEKDADLLRSHLMGQGI